MGTKVPLPKESLLRTGCPRIFVEKHGTSSGLDESNIIGRLVGKKKRKNKEIANPYGLEEEEDDDDDHHHEGNNDNKRVGSKSHSSVSNYNTKGKEKVG